MTLDEAIAQYTEYAECIPEEGDMIDMYHRYRNEWQAFNSGLHLVLRNQPLGFHALGKRKDQLFVLRRGLHRCKKCDWHNIAVPQPGTKPAPNAKPVSRLKVEPVKRRK